MKSCSIILSSDFLYKWQYDCIDYNSDLFAVKKILICRNSRSNKRYFKHFLYYFYILIVRFKLFSYKKSPLPDIDIIFFDTQKINSYEHLPKNVVDTINDYDFCIRFGMNIIHIPDSLNVPILSFHHGDPYAYKGRPACFYEILNYEKQSYQILQILNNHLDSGKIVSASAISLYNNSYSKSLEETLSFSKFTLNKALLSSFSNIKEFSFSTNSKSHSLNMLPSNLIFIKFLILLSKNKLRKFLISIFYFKIWKIGYFQTDLDIFSALKSDDFKDHRFSIPFDNLSDNYLFFADPFFADNGELYYEGFNKSTCKGDILKKDLSGKHSIVLSSTKCHFSYPFIFNFNNKSYLIPEMSTEDQCVYNLYGDFLFKLNIEHSGLIDPTFYYQDDIIYLFFTLRGNPNSLLHVYTSRDIEGNFVRHPSSPISTANVNSRCGGTLVSNKGELFLKTQDCHLNYGNSLSINKIELDPYSITINTNTQSICFNGFNGPHTVNSFSDLIVYDYYTEVFSLKSLYYKIRNFL